MIFLLYNLSLEKTFHFIVLLKNTSLIMVLGYYFQEDKFCSLQDVWRFCFICQLWMAVSALLVIMAVRVTAGRAASTAAVRWNTMDTTARKVRRIYQVSVSPLRRCPHNTGEICELNSTSTVRPTDDINSSRKRSFRKLKRLHQDKDEIFSLHARVFLKQKRPKRPLIMYYVFKFLRLGADWKHVMCFLSENTFTWQLQLATKFVLAQWVRKFLYLWYFACAP